MNVFTYMSICASCVYSPYGGGQNNMMIPLELELCMVINHYVGSGN